MTRELVTVSFNLLTTNEQVADSDERGKVRLAIENPRNSLPEPVARRTTQLPLVEYWPDDRYFVPTDGSPGGLVSYQRPRTTIAMSRNMIPTLLFGPKRN